MKYGIIDTATLTKRPGNGYCGHTPNELALAVGMAMPNRDRKGLPGKRGDTQFAAPLAALYMGHGLEWATNGLKPRNDKALGYDSGTNKNNAQTGLVVAGFITVAGTQKGGGECVILTDAGVERCKAVDAQLGKLAKGFTLAAYTKALKAAERAAKATARVTDAFDGDAATEVADQPDNSTSEAPSGFDHTEATVRAETAIDEALATPNTHVELGADGYAVVTADQVEAAAQADFEASTERLSDHE